MLERRLKRTRLEVLIARDGAEGVANAGAEQPDLILMDMGLPVLDGWAATSRVKAAPAAKHIPVIALTQSYRRRAPTKIGGQMLKRGVELFDAVVTR